MEKIHILLYYKFVGIENPAEFADEHLKFCKSLGLSGKVLVGKEGINGSVCGTKQQIKKYKSRMKKDERFRDIVFKEDIGDSAPFTKMAVRVRPEIIAMKENVDLNMKGDYVSAEELFNMYEGGEDFVILDARNDYEWKVGKFKNAVTLSIKSFREFPKEVKKLKNKLTGKKIVTYCTGGIRCEKASAYMKQIGFENVFQLKDGIITFCKEYPDSFWEGKCFVFDKRLLADYNNFDNDISNCGVCGGACDLYRNCRNTDCDKLSVMCVSCEKEMSGCCSHICLESFRKACLEKSRKNQGRKTRTNFQAQ